MNKKLIIITAAVGLLSSGGMFVLAWLTKAAPEAPGPDAEQTTAIRRQDDLELAQPQIDVSSVIASVGGKMKKTMIEKQLKGLIYEVREKIEEYDLKLKNLELREQRLLIAHNTAKKDIEEFTNLRIDLASTVAALKDEKDKLEASRIQIALSEKNNLMSIAAAYDKMDSTSAGNILTNISKSESSSSDDAVKILHYMTERTKAKVLASIAETEPATSADFCQKLKRIIEKE